MDDENGRERGGKREYEREEGRANRRKRGAESGNKLKIEGGSRKEWRQACRQSEREVMLAQQKELRLKVMHEQHIEKEAYAAFLTRLPKFEGDQSPVVFLQALEKQFNEWLGALEGCLTGKALNTYWNLIEESQRAPTRAPRR